MPTDMTIHGAAETTTIAAFAAALGGPITIIRVSGSESLRVAQALWQGGHPLSRPPHRVMRLGVIQTAEGCLDDQVLAVYMPGPNSYTGEDVVELHCHGGVLSARMVLRELLRQGCRHADPGEFTRRAFLNGRLDLTQAEAVADLIEAHSDRAVHLANRQLDGMLGRCVNRIYDLATDILAEIESRMDFPEEELDWRTPAALESQVRELATSTEDLLASRREGEIMRDGIQLVLAGPPNVGKSSLLNLILGRDRAIVTDIPGTTRDTLEEFVHLRGIPVRLVDTAGIREARDLVEQSGVERSISSMAAAQLVLWVIDASRPYEQQACPASVLEERVILVANKADLLLSPPVLPPGLPPPVLTCAVTGKGLPELFDAIETDVLGSLNSSESEVAVNARHAALLESILADVIQARACLSHDHLDLTAVCLRGALQDLGRITGRTVDPDILETIFSRFCIGK